MATRAEDFMRDTEVRVEDKAPAANCVCHGWTWNHGSLA